MHYGNVMLSGHNFKLGNQTVYCLNLLDMSEVATTSVMPVLVISKIPRVHNYNHSVTNRRTLNLMDISVMRYTTHTLICVWRIAHKNSARLDFFLTGLAWLDLVKYQICPSLRAVIFFIYYGERLLNFLVKHLFLTT